MRRSLKCIKSDKGSHFGHILILEIESDRRKGITMSTCMVIQHGPRTPGTKETLLVYIFRALNRE